MPKNTEKHRSQTSARTQRNRLWWSEQIKTLAVVIPLSGLIWIYAERAQTWSDKAQVYLQVDSADPSLFASLDDESAQSITVELSGPRAKVESVKARLEPRSGDRRYRVMLSSNFGSNENPNLPVADLLSNDPEIAASGVSITTASPATVKVSIEKLVSREVVVRMPPTLPATLSNLVFSPPTIQIRGPSSVMDRLYSRSTSAVEVDLTSPPTTLFAVGPHTERLPLKVPTGEPVTFGVANVTARFEVAAREAEYTIPALPIMIEMPLPLHRRVAVVTRQLIATNVKVRGPADAIAKLRPPADGTSPPAVAVAVLKVTSDDIGRTDLRRTCTIGELPPGVTVVGSPPEIDFSVESADRELENPG